MDGELLRVVDANVFIHATGTLPWARVATVPGVTAELKSTDAARRYDLETVDVYEPSEDAVDTVRKEAEAIGEDLSDTDIEVVSLAYEKEAVLVSDDYGVQNVALHLDVRVEAFHQDRIDGPVVWTRRCPNCGEERSGAECAVCNVETRRVSRPGE